MARVRMVARCASFGANDPNEDAAFSICGHESLLAGVVDGHGGPDIARAVPDMLAKELHFDNESSTGKTKRPGNIVTELRSAFQKLESRVRSNKSLSEQGAAAAVLLCRGNQLALASIGDCRAVAGEMYDGSVLARCVSARPDNLRDPVRMYRAHQAGHTIVFNESDNDPAFYVNDLQCTRSIGDDRLKRKRNATITGCPHMRDVTDPLNNPDICFLVLCTDGLTDHLSDRDIVRIVCESGYTTEEECAAAASMLVSHAKRQAAFENRLSTPNFEQLQPGDSLRDMCDDMATVVLGIRRTPK